MPHWMFKAAAQGVMSRLPWSQGWNRFFQVHLTRSLELSDDYLISKWEQSVRHVQNLQRFGVPTGDAPIETFAALELGTGWFPIVPIGLALSGAKVVHSLDMQNLMSRERVIETLQRYQVLISTGHIQFRDPQAGRRIEQILTAAAGKNVRALLATLGIRILIADARHVDLPSGGLDLVCSNNTLEHIPPEVAVDIFLEFRRLLRPGGVMSHFIDMADHYAKFDQNISEYNFLRFSSRTWRWFNNDLQYQNRLRVSDFRDLHRTAGLALLDEDNIRGTPQTLRSMPIAAEFRRYSESDLSVYATWMVSRSAVQEAALAADSQATNRSTC